jgi:two-component sensor histidine kinase
LFIATTRDITKRKQDEENLRTSIKEKEMLLQEIHHRVKNNLQIISSILDMSHMRMDDPRAQDLISDARSKIQTMTFIHTQLYKSERFDRIEMGAHIKELIHYLSAAYARSKTVSCFVEISDVYLTLTQAIPCALVLNELISNAFKHAFKEGQRGTIEVSMDVTAGNRVFLRVRDDGIGLKKGVDIHKTDTLGLKLVRNLVEKQLRGKIEIQKKKYTEFLITFEKKEEGNG